MIFQIRTCISDIKRLGELHKKDQLDVTDKNLLSKLVENVPARNKLKSDRRKYRSKHQLNEQSIPGKPTQEFNCNLLSIGMPSRTMPTFSLAHLANNDTTHLKIVEPTVEKQKVALPPQLLSPSSFENHLPLRPLINNVISPSTPLIPASKDPTALMFSSLEKELLNLLDVEELSKLLPGFSQNSSQLLKASAPGIEQVASAGLPGSSITRSDSLMSTRNLFKTWYIWLLTNLRNMDSHANKNRNQEIGFQSMDFLFCLSCNC